MGQGFKETAFYRTDLKKFNENFDKIFGNKKEEPVEVQQEMFDNITNKDVSTNDLNEMVDKMLTLKKDYEDKKDLSTAAYHKYQEAQAQLISTLREAGLSKYHAEGLGTASVKTTMKVQTPKSPEDKSALFKWLKETLGVEGFLTYAGVNYNSLKSLYNSQYEAAKEAGTAADFSIPGVGVAEAEFSLSFRKS